ncbi:MAG: EthD domain-containing protein, partial [Microthrixaceae bacterium]
LVRRNPTLDPVTFREFWYGHQSPMSGEVQPRLHYVRNTVVHPVTPGAPPYDGIVLECWPSPEVVADPIEFHGGPEVGEENLRVMLDSVSQIFDMTSLRSLAMSEYLYG